MSILDDKNLQQTALQKAYRIATFSPDPSTQNGALLVDMPGNLIVDAYNEFPPGVQYTEERWERPTKYSFIEHAERGAIYKACRLGKPTRELALVCCGAACADCARAIALSGLRHVITHKKYLDTIKGWDLSLAREILEESNISVIYYKGKVGGPKVRISGQYHEL